MEFVKTYQNSLGKLTADNIIKIFEEEPGKREGITGSGMNKKFKDTTDLHSNDLAENRDWIVIEDLLRKELTAKLMRYYYEINKGEMSDSAFNPYPATTDSGFQIQRYTAGEGHYHSVHSDFDLNNGRFRTLTYIWYLNDVDEGGETLFYTGDKIKPEMGKLLIFPALWTYPHSGLMPLSNHKYILTGWIYSSF